MVIDSRPVADQDENMNVPGRKRGFRIGVGVLAALCAVLLGLTALSGCRLYVMGSTPRSPFLGEWHADYTWDGVSYSTEYEFDNNGRYSYSNIRRSTSGMVGEEEMTRGSYDYDNDTLFLTPVPSDVAPSQFEYEFMNGNMLELRERITTSRTRVVVYHRHS